MKRFLFSLFLMLLLVTPALADTGKTVEAGKVISVADGKNITIRTAKGRHIRVTLYGIDVPKLKNKFGKQSRSYLSSFIKDETIDITPIGKPRKYSLTGTLSLDRDNINELMILNGQAWVDKKRCTQSFCATWEKMEAAARATQKGMWKQAPETAKQAKETVKPEKAVHPGYHPAKR